MVVVIMVKVVAYLLPIISSNFKKASVVPSSTLFWFLLDLILISFVEDIIPKGLCAWIHFL